MKISLLTIWREKNYGAEMQAYATVKMLQKLGCDVKMIDFRLSDMYASSLKYKIVNFITYLTPQNLKFELFWKKYIPTTRRYSTIESLYANPPESDVYVVGSDQVWNLDLVKDALPLFFLDFANNYPRISYASSFGTTNWVNMDKTVELVQKNLLNFIGISCRELSGVELLSENFDIQSTHVLDPTLLFNGYPELVQDVSEVKTLVYYPVYPDKELEQFCLDLATERELEYLNTGKKIYVLKKILWDRPSIQQWIKNIASSSLVVTSSFHGLAFSLIYKRQFVVVIKDRSRVTRIWSLLEVLGLEDRYFSSIEDFKKSKIWQIPIDYEMVNKKLSSLRDESINYLKIVLGNI